MYPMNQTALQLGFQRGKHPDCVFTYKGEPWRRCIRRMAQRLAARWHL